MVYTYNENITQPQKTGNLAFVTAWMDLAWNLFMGISQTEEQYCIVSLTCGILKKQKRKQTKTDSQWWGVTGRMTEKGERRLKF